MSTRKSNNPDGRPARHPGPMGAVAITLPVSILEKIEQDRERVEATGERDPGRSGMIATILHDHYQSREKEALGAA